MNFVKELLGISTNNSPLISFDEMAAKSLWRYLQYGFALIGVNKIDCVKMEVVKELQVGVVKRGFRYIPIFGRCMNGGYLVTFAVVNLNKCKELCDFDTLRLFAAEMTVKYAQRVSVCEPPSYTSVIPLIGAFFEDWLKENGLPYLYKGCYLNPPPMCYSERYMRDMKMNEVFIGI